jgi:hypothetical protein
VPVTEILLIEITVVPLLCNVTVCFALLAPTFMAGKVRADGVTASVLIIPVPVPESETVWLEANPAFVMVSAPLRAPLAVGVKINAMVQLEEPAIEEPHVLLEIVKSPAFSPETAMLLMSIAELLMFLRVTV